MNAETKLAAPGRERLLDAAEELFAAKGYYGASMRAITGRAGVELGLANYHFGTKDELYRQVVLRRAPIMAADLERALVDARAEGSLAAIYSAFARTHLMRLHDEVTGWRHYMRLAADIALKDHDERLTSGASEIYQPTLGHYIGAIAAFQRNLSHAEIERSFYLFHRAVLSTLIHAGGRNERTSWPCATEIDALVATMVRIFSSGT